MKKIQNKIISLRKELHEHNHRYYVQDEPIITDFIFDKMLRDLQDLERQYPEFYDPNSPSQRVGGEIICKVF